MIEAPEDSYGSPRKFGDRFAFDRIALFAGTGSSTAIAIKHGHVAKIGAAYAAIWNQWLPEHNRIAADGACIERHGDTFDPRTGLGGVDIWIPLKEAAGA